MAKSASWKPRHWIVPPGLLFPLERFAIRCNRLIQRAKTDPQPLLIKAPTGSGKTMFVEYFLHEFLNKYPERKVRFVNCAAFPPSLLESEMFGHVKGAFTGATKDKDGHLLSVADGVLVLEEIGELPDYLQAKLLTAIESKRFIKVGDTKEVEMKAQIVATTNVHRKKFRDDFWYRFEAISIPPIHQRRSDILFYIELFDPELLEMLPKGSILSALCYHWPGNVREIERVCSAIREEALHYAEAQKLEALVNEALDDNTEFGLTLHPFEYQQPETSGYSFRKAQALCSELESRGVDVKKIEQALESSDLGFECYEGAFQSWLGKSLSLKEQAGGGNGYFSVVLNHQYLVAFAGLASFCKLFLLDMTADSDLLDMESIYTADQAKRELSKTPLPELESHPFTYKKAKYHKNKNLLEQDIAKYSGICFGIYESPIESIKSWPKHHQEAFLEAFAYRTDIQGLSTSDLTNLEELFQRNPTNKILAKYLGQTIETITEETPIESIDFTDLKRLYYETICNKIGTSHGFKKKLAAIANKAQSTITQDFKDLGLNEKFSNPKFYPQKRLSIHRKKKTKS